jgi:ubiquinone biosynthesis protein UbiJ
VLAAALVPPLNHLLRQAEWARHRLRAHAGQVVELKLPVTTVRLVVGDDGYVTQDQGEASPALALSVPVEAAIAALSGPETAMKHVRIAGNAEFGQAVGFVLRHLEWDAEADLARVVGDVAAPRLHRGVSAFFAWQRDALRRSSDNLRDYLVVERPSLIASTSLEHFAAELIALRDDLARLDKRVARLERHA